jgi:hypothetical protein
VIAMAGRVLIRIGIAMLILSLLIRFAIEDKAAMMGDNLAIIACLLVIATGFIGARIGRRIDEPLAEIRAKKIEGGQRKKDH